MCGKMAEELLSLKWNNHQAHFVDILTFLREQEIFVDATLACGGKLYAAHKFVLSTCSDYFKQMFTKNPSKHPIVFMKDVSTRDLEALLDFMYNGEVNVPQSSLGSLIKTAEGLQIKGLAVPDDPPAKRDRDNKRDSKPQERLSPPPKRPRVRENSPVHSLPSRSLAQSSYTPTPSSSSINRPRSPLPPTNTSSGVSQTPIEGTLDEDSRTSIQSGVSGLSEHNSSTTPSLSSKIGSSSQQIQSNAGDINSHLEQSGTEEPSPGPSGIQKQEIKQEDIVDLGEDDDGDWGTEGDAGGGDSSMGSENPPSFPDVILPHGSDAMQGHTGDPAMTMRLILGELGEAGGGASTLLPEGSGGGSNNIPLARRGTVSASSSATVDVQHTHAAPEYDILEYCLSDSMTDQLPGEHPRSPPHGLHHSSSSTGRLQGAQTSGDHQLVTGALLYQSRPYACPYCAKRFKRKDHLVEHERTHTGERPYVCRECGKSFAKKTNLNTHVRSHHIQRQHHVQPGPLDLKSNSISP